MKSEDYKGHRKDSHHHGEGCEKNDKDFHHRGAKTFRRGRALAFLEMMNLKRSTLKQQLEAPEFQSIHQILVGELKAIDMVINEFAQLFELHEVESMASNNKKNEEGVISSSPSEESQDKDEKELN